MTAILMDLVDQAMQQAYGDSLYDAGYRWLVDALSDCELEEEVTDILTDENMHSVIDAMESGYIC